MPSDLRKRCCRRFRLSPSFGIDFDPGEGRERADRAPRVGRHEAYIDRFTRRLPDEIGLVAQLEYDDDRYQHTPTPATVTGSVKILRQPGMRRRLFVFALETVRRETSVPL